MSLLVPLRPRPGAPLAEANPVAKLAAALALMTAAFLSIDPVTPALLLVALALALPATGIAARDLLARAWPLLVAALALAILNAVFSERGGPALLQIGPVSIDRDAVVGGAAVGLRVLGVAMAGLLAVVSTDPTALADALQQQLRVPPRVAVAALAALRMAPAIAAEWQVLRLARRARGVSAGGSPLAALRIFGSQLVGLLVSAIRRATRLATAMEARAFGSRGCRTVARPRQMDRSDWLLLGGAVVVGGAAMGTSMALGTWRFLLGSG